MQQSSTRCSATRIPSSGRGSSRAEFAQLLHQEPFGFEAGDANFYRYVGNDPTNFTDPTGLKILNPDLPGFTAEQKTELKKADEELTKTIPLVIAEVKKHSSDALKQQRTKAGLPVPEALLTKYKQAQEKIVANLETIFKRLTDGFNAQFNMTRTTYVTPDKTARHEIDAGVWAFVLPSETKRVSEKVTPENSPKLIHFTEEYFAKLGQKPDLAGQMGTLAHELSHWVLDTEHYGNRVYPDPEDSKRESWKGKVENGLNDARFYGFLFEGGNVETDVAKEMKKIEEAIFQDNWIRGR
jgi:hypothetical protein